MNIENKPTTLDFAQYIESRGREVRIWITRDDFSQQSFLVSRLSTSNRYWMWDQYCQSEVAPSGDDYYAQFRTSIGTVTYVFCRDGKGYQIGPKTKMTPFTWSFD